MAHEKGIKKHDLKAWGLLKHKNFNNFIKIKRKNQNHYSLLIISHND